jgi:hypothetical protein
VNTPFDGDELNMVFMKEMGEVPKFMAIHPMTTLLGEDRCEISSMVALTKEATVAVHSWLMDDVKLPA